MADDRLSFKIHYRRNLPHIQPPGASLFITFRLVGSLPVLVQRTLQAKTEEDELALKAVAEPVDRAQKRYEVQKQHFGRWDAALDRETTGPHWLKEPQIAKLVASSIQCLDGRLYELDSYCIMSNHVHLLITPLQDANRDYYGLPKILHSLKGYTAKHANKILGRQGQFWQRESYDHIIRDRDEFLRVRRYILDNPVKAGLVEQWTEWPYSYCIA